MTDPKTILIIGASGFIGSSLARALRKDHKVVGAHHSKPVFIPGQNPLPLDVRDQSRMKRILGVVQPDVVVYCAGSDDPDNFEEHKVVQDGQHAVGVNNLLNATQFLNSQIILFSNCYVFDGIKGSYHEGDKVIPDREIGKSKVTAESYVRSRSMNYVVLRTGPVYGVGPARSPNFLDRLRVALARGEQVSLKDDEVHSFVAVDMVIEVIRAAIETGIRNKTLHLGSTDVCSWYEWGQRSARTLGLDESKVVKMSTDALGQKKNYSLLTSNEIKSLEVKAPVLEEALDLIQKHLILSI